MKVIVTGGAGFIGSHLVELLCKKKEIKKILILDYLNDGSIKNIKNILKDKKVILKKVDIRKSKESFVRLFQNTKCVFHLAAMSDVVPSITDPKNYLETNIMGTMNVLEAMRKNKVNKIIYAASSSCYGIPKKYPTNENETISPKYPYAFSKNIGEQTIKHWSYVYNINFISLRLFNVYGTRSRTHGAYGAALGVFLKQKLSNKPFTIVGNGKQKRDFINVKDVSEVFYKAFKSNKSNKIYNVGSGKPISVNKLVSLLKGKKVFIPKRPGEPDITYANINMIKDKLNWSPKISIQDGVKEVLANINYWKKSPLWTKSKIKKATKDWFKYLKK
tara:strand:- start:1798 stop:2793 length:996 start_codon:yes stop_codon:yes gene_type:complete